MQSIGRGVRVTKVCELWKCQVTESFEDQNQNLVLGEAHELDEYICNMDVMWWTCLV